MTITLKALIMGHVPEIRIPVRRMVTFTAQKALRDAGYRCDLETGDDFPMTAEFVWRLEK